MTVSIHQVSVNLWITHNRAVDLTKCLQRKQFLFPGTTLITRIYFKKKNRLNICTFIFKFNLVLIVIYSYFQNFYFDTVNICEHNFNFKIKLKTNSQFVPWGIYIIRRSEVRIPVLVQIFLLRSYNLNFYINTYTLDTVKICFHFTAQ